jgi:1-acyl-sn-glycerol-3-phosphate acyltransferase
VGDVPAPIGSGEVGVMTGERVDERNAELAMRDPSYVSKVLPFVRLPVQRWFRAHVDGIGNIPDGGALLVSNHSGGVITFDVPVLAVAFFDHFGIDRPLYVLAHDAILRDPIASWLRRAGIVTASRANADAILRSGAVTIVFPGGDHDVFRPTAQSNVVDFHGRSGYVRTAREAGVPIVPVVSIGGQESQLFLSRGERLARLLKLEQRFRTKYLPISIGFPFGLTAVFPLNLPLPTKIVTKVLPPIWIDADDDDAAVDRAVRRHMQEALDELAAKRRFPVLG